LKFGADGVQRDLFALLATALSIRLRFFLIPLVRALW
jgi:hypothetical protein